MTGQRVESTRERILAILRRREGLGVNELAEEIGLAGATVRRHLDVLLRDGHVSIQQVKGRTGRPRYVFALTKSGAEQFPHHYVRLTHRLLDEIVSLDARETQGRDGRALAGLVFERMAERLAAEYGPRLRAGPLEERARRAAELLAEEGIEFEVVGAPAGAIDLVGRGCPCLRLVAALGAGDAQARLGCEHDRRLLERLLDVPVTPLPRDALASDALCGYRLEPAPVPPSPGAMPAVPLVPLA